MRYSRCCSTYCAALRFCSPSRLSCEYHIEDDDTKMFTITGLETMRVTRLGEAYHAERALAARQGIPRYPCGCERCHGFKTQSVRTVETHHRKYGRDNRLEEPLLVSST